MARPEPDPDVGDLTDRLLDAASAVFAERGYDRAGVAEIARRAGVTTGAIYSRYSGKAELLLAAADRDLPAAFRALLAGHHQEPATEVLSMLGTSLLDQPSSPLVLEATVAARREPELASRLRHRIEDEERHLAKLFDEAKADGRIYPALSTAALVRLCHAIGDGMTMLQDTGLPNPDPADWAAVIDRLILAAAPERPDPDGPTLMTPGRTTPEPARHRT